MSSEQLPRSKPDRTPNGDAAYDDVRMDEPRIHGFDRILGSTRIVVVLGSAACLLASISLLLAAVLAVFHTIWSQISDGEIGIEAAHHAAVEFIQLTDIVLLGVVLYIISLGLYELFFRSDLPIPHWLRFHNLSELKASLIEVILVLLGVTFLGRAVSWSGGRSILYFGIACAAIIAALSLALLVEHIRNRDSDTPH